jgi:hypothetical protein
MADGQSNRQDSAATPLGSLTPADAPLIDAENLFRQLGPPLPCTFDWVARAAFGEADIRWMIFREWLL